jgi:hypothetical protein
VTTSDLTCPEGQPTRLDAALAETCPEGQLVTRPAPSQLTSLPAAGERLHLGPVTLELHPVLRTTLLIAWAALSGACREQASDPVRAAQAFTVAVQTGDMKSVLPLLEKSALVRLEQSAAQASDQVGGRRSIEPAEMLQIVDVSPTFELAQTELVDNDGTTAHVRLLGAQQETYTLTLVHEDGAWHVRIPIP